MKLIIAGSRSIHDLCPYWFRDTLNNFGIDCKNHYLLTEIVSGTAKGVDSLGERFAKKYIIKITRFPANWDEYGPSAGHIRNQEMAEYADALFLVWDGKSKGSKSMKDKMLKLGKPIYEVIIKND